MLALPAHTEHDDGSTSTGAVLGVASKKDVDRVDEKVEQFRRRLNRLDSGLYSLNLDMHLTMFRMLLKGVEPRDIEPQIEAKLREIGIYHRFGLMRDEEGNLVPDQEPIQLQPDLGAEVLPYKVWGRADAVQRRAMQLERIVEDGRKP